MIIKKKFKIQFLCTIINITFAKKKYFKKGVIFPLKKRKKLKKKKDVILSFLCSIDYFILV